MSFPRYAEYKDSGVEWLREVPAHWGVLPIKRDLDFITSGSRGWADHYADDGELFIRIGNLTRDSLELDLSDIQRVAVPSGSEGERTTVKPGDLLFSITAYLGSVAIAPNWLEPSYVSQHVALARLAGQKLTPRWVGYAVLSFIGKTYLETQAYGGTKIQLGLDDVANLVTTVPPIPEQTAIAAFLDRETGKIDALVAEQEKLIALLKEKRQAVISHAVTKGLNPNAPMKPSGIEWLGDVPAHWSVKRLKFIVGDDAGVQMGPFGGMLLELDSSETGYKVYGQENTISGDFSLGSRWIDAARFADLERYEITTGDIVLTRKGSLGNARLISQLPHRGIADSDTIRVRVNPKLMSSAFLALLMHRSGYIAEQLALAKRGAILAGINTETVSGLTAIVPDIAEQEQLLVHVAELDQCYGDLIREAENTVALLRERRSALISAAVTGQIDVRDFAARLTSADDEETPFNPPRLRDGWLRETAI
ncbi:MAG: restriction endonuclease subunit S [Stagnimonas sp.]|nr:restriction endonuclease subunit S [Stagnimonas sp.]